MCKKRKVYTMSELNLSIMKMFNQINADFFDNQLPKVVITFESGYKKGAYGWITTVKDWKQGNEERYHINISSDYLDRPINNIISTLIHEMCHLYAIENDIQDTSRSGIYHNKRFKQIAESHGLFVDKADKIGWSVTSLTPETEKYIENVCPISEIRIIKKRPSAFGCSKPKNKQSARKYICPSCGLIVRATKDCRISCLDCDCTMELKQAED